MSILESLFVSVFGMAVVFIVLIGLSLLIRLQTVLYFRFTQKKPAAAAVVQETPAPIVQDLSDAADTSLKNVGNDQSVVYEGDRQQGEMNRALRTVQSAYSGYAEKTSGGGEKKRKYVASVNGKVYEAEVEEVQTPPRQDTAATS